ncbi:MAG: hypothetical protein ACRDH7_07555 [Actinomycetota bacterium]
MSTKPPATWYAERAAWIMTFSANLDDLAPPEPIGPVSKRRVRLPAERLAVDRAMPDVAVVDERREREHHNPRSRID